MNIVLIREHYRPDGGAERFVARILDILAQQTQVNITLLTRKWQGDNKQRNLELIELRSGGFGRLQRHRRFSVAVQQQLAQRHYDLIQSHERIPGADIYRAGDGVHREWLATRIRHGGLFERISIGLSRFHRYINQAEKDLFLHPRMQRIVCNSKLIRDDIRRHYPEVPEERLEVIYNGVDLEHFHPQSDAQQQQARAQLGIDADAPVMLTVGSGFLRKGFGAAIDALTLLPDEWQLIMVGKERNQARYEAQVKRLGLVNRVHFLGPQSHPLPWFAAADVLVHPALYEPFGNVILEAMACGKAVCMSHRSGCVELIEPGISGYVCEPGDAQSLAHALQQVSHRDQWVEMGKQARLCAEKLTLDAMNQQYLSLYQTLLSKQ